jgi:hypothetical protein
MAQVELNEEAFIRRMQLHEQSFLDFIDLYKDNRTGDLLAVADHNERLDHISNMARQDCVLITGNGFLYDLYKKVNCFLVFLFYDFRS